MFYLVFYFLQANGKTCLETLGATLIYNLMYGPCLVKGDTYYPM